MDLKVKYIFDNDVCIYDVLESIIVEKYNGDIDNG